MFFSRVRFKAENDVSVAEKKLDMASNAIIIKI